MAKEKKAEVPQGPTMEQINYVPALQKKYNEEIIANLTKEFSYSRLVLGDDPVALGVILLLALVQLDGEALVVFGDLLAQVARAGVDHEIFRAVRRTVDLD